MTEEEMQELETLRKEKQQRIQRTRAAEALEKAGISASFAELLAGGDDGETDRRTEAFRTVYQAAMAENVRARLPRQAPVMDPPMAVRPKRGIQRIR